MNTNNQPRRYNAGRILFPGGISQPCMDKHPEGAFVAFSDYQHELEDGVKTRALLQAERERAEAAIQILQQYRQKDPKVICPRALIDVVLEALCATQPDPLKLQGPYISSTQPPVAASSTPATEP